MKLQADRIDVYLKDRLVWVFNSASKDDTTNLGTHFAPVVYDGPQSLRVGLIGYIDAGKSAFARGAIHAVEHKICMEENWGDLRLRQQGRWIVPGRRSIRQYDAAYKAPPSVLESYFKKEDMLASGLPHTDIVEHPKCDMHNTEFDCLISIESQEYKNDRTISVVPTNELVDSEVFQSFIAAAKPYLIEYRDGKPNNTRKQNPYLRLWC